MPEPLSAEREQEIRALDFRDLIRDNDERTAAHAALSVVCALLNEITRLRAIAHAMSTAHRENWRRLFIDGGGNLFVDVCTDTDGTILVAPCHPDSFGDEMPLAALEAEHGILTQIGLVS